MYQCIGKEGPHICAAPRQRATKHNRTVVARRNESEAEQKFDVLLLAENEYAHRMNKHQHSQHGDDNRRDVEKRFALHEETRWET